MMALNEVSNFPKDCCAASSACLEDLVRLNGESGGRRLR
jgi:hypothetical protein